MVVDNPGLNRFNEPGCPLPEQRTNIQAIRPDKRIKVGTFDV